MTVQIGEPPEHVNRWLYERLVQAAKAGELLTYSEVGGPLKLNFDSPADRNKIGHLLGEISRFEVSEGRPMLSSLVWHAGFTEPGKGLRKLGIELGLVRGDEDDQGFAARQAKATYAYWQSLR